MENKNDEIKVNILDVLLDENNTAPIIFFDSSGGKIEFDQLAVIPYKDELYCVLKPLTKIDGIKDNEAVVFKVVQEEDDEPFLRVEADELVSLAVFNAYYDLIENHNQGVDEDD